MARWLSFRGGLSERGLRDIGGSFGERDLLKSIVRESVQNSLDAKRSDAEKVSMEFCYQTIQTADIPGSDRLTQIFGYCRDFVTSENEKAILKRGFNMLQPGAALGMLRISDHGTVGLTGLRDYSENGRFRGLVTRMGMGNDDATRGGNFGVGKQALFLASGLRTIFFSSIDSETQCAGHMGVAKLSSFRDPELQGANGTPLLADRTIYYCADAYVPENQDGNPVIKGQFCLAGRAEGDFGTDVFIMGFVPDDEASLSIKILTILFLEFIVAVDEERLEVTLPDGFTFSKNTLDEAFNKFSSGRPHIGELRTVESYIALLRKPWKTSPQLPVGDGMPPFPEGAIQYKFTRSESDNFCRITREKGMFVHKVGSVCGSANCVGIAAIRDPELNASFKSMENEAHDAFRVTDIRFPNREQKKLAEAQLKTLKKFLKECAKEEMEPEISSRTAAVLPDEMKELMDVCVNQLSVTNGKRTPRNRSLKPAGARVDRMIHKPKAVVQAKSAGLDEAPDTEDPQETGVIHTREKANKRELANAGGKTKINETSPEANGYVMRPLNVAPDIYACGAASSGRYRVSFTVPRDRAKICLCFSATTQTDSQERLGVKSVAAVDVNGNPIPAVVDLGGTAISFENVTKDQRLTAEVQFDVSYYCYSQMRYYEKKNN